MHLFLWFGLAKRGNSLKKAALFIIILFIFGFSYGKEKYSINIVQYDVKHTKCQIDDKIVKYITDKAGYGCAEFKGKMNVNIGEKEEISVADFMNNTITLNIVGRKGTVVDIQVKIPNEMDAIFSPVLGGSFVVGYDLDDKKHRGVMFLIYVV